MQKFKRTFFLTWLPFAFFIPCNYAQNRVITKAFLTGHYDYTTDTAFIKVDSRYANRGIFLQKTTYRAYIKMYAAALKDGVELSIMSGTRSFDDQHYKWESEWNSAQFAEIKNTATKAEKLLRWWSMPGTSRHHWGTDIDLVHIKPAWYQAAEGKKMYEWLVKNASKYGFYQPFNAGRASGYQEEKWHWSYLPLSKIYLNEYTKQVTCKDILGFDGCSAAKELNVLNNWVLGINPVCK
jgi:D-alanyl-D-alanine carboxypeptidase